MIAKACLELGLPPSAFGITDDADVCVVADAMLTVYAAASAKATRDREQANREAQLR